MKKVFLLLSLLLFSSCQMPGWLSSWQQKQLEKRYGKTVENSTLREWQKQAEGFEKIINKQAAAGSRAGAYFRQLGVAFAEMESFELCTENIEKAIHYGLTDAETFYYKGLCEANLAKRHNWQYDYATKAEASFLKALSNDPTHAKSKYYLGLVYFHGYGSNNPFRVLNEELTATQMDYREKAIALLEQYRSENNRDTNGYFALAQIYAITGDKAKAMTTTSDLTNMLIKQYPNHYKEMPEYKNAIENLKQLNP